MNCREESLPRAGRREFMGQAAQLLGVAVCGFSLASVVASCESDKIVSSQTVSLDYDVSTLALNTPTFVDFTAQKGQPVVIVRVADKEYNVFTAVCTHENQLMREDVNWDGNIHCYVHDSIFDSKTGAVIEGKANAPLKKFTATYNDTTKKITIQFS